MEMTPLISIARGHEGHWEAICLDLDIAVQGRTFEDVYRDLKGAVDSYVDDAMREDADTRDQLLSRRAPLRVRAGWLTGVVFAGLTGRLHKGQRNGHSSVPFALPCHA